MIASFKDSDLEKFHYEGAGKRTRRIPADVHGIIRRKLDMLFNATTLNDLRVPPANRLKKLRGRLRGRHSIRVNDQWRIVFRWERGAAHDVQLTDYH